MRIMHQIFACLCIKYMHTVQLQTNANTRLRDVSLGKSSISELKTILIFLTSFVSVTRHISTSVVTRTNRICKYTYLGLGSVS